MAIFTEAKRWVITAGEWVLWPFAGAILFTFPQNATLKTIDLQGMGEIKYNEVEGDVNSLRLPTGATAELVYQSGERTTQFNIRDWRFKRHTGRGGDAWVNYKNGSSLHFDVNGQVQEVAPGLRAEYIQEI